MKIIQLIEAKESKKELTKKSLEKDAEIKALKDQVNQVNLVNLRFKKSITDLDTMINQQRNPTDRRRIGFEFNKKYHEAESYKKQKIEDLNKKVLKMSTELKKPLEESLR